MIQKASLYFLRSIEYVMIVKKINVGMMVKKKHGVVHAVKYLF
jgi:hypothetical protein